MKIYEIKIEIDSLFGLIEARTKTLLYDINPDTNAQLIDIYSISEDEHYLFMNYLQLTADDVYSTIQRLSDFKSLYRQLLEPNEPELPRYSFDIQDEETLKRIVQYRVLLPDKFVQTKLINDITEALICGVCEKHFKTKGYEKGIALFSNAYIFKISDLKTISSGSNNDRDFTSQTRRRGLW